MVEVFPLLKLGLNLSLILEYDSSSPPNKLPTSRGRVTTEAEKEESR